MLPWAKHSVVRTFDMTIDREALATPEQLFGELSCPTRWPDNVGSVLGVSESDPTPNGQLCWNVEAGVKIGPFRKATTIRLARTEFVVEKRVMFERIGANESNGEHAALQFSVDLDTLGPRGAQPLTRVRARLVFAGSLPPGLEGLIRNEIEKTIAKLSRAFAI